MCGTRAGARPWARNLFSDSAQVIAGAVGRADKTKPANLLAGFISLLGLMLVFQCRDSHLRFLLHNDLA